MASIRSEIRVMRPEHHYLYIESDDTDAVVKLNCVRCGPAHMLVIGAEGGDTAWLRCSVCGHPHFHHRGTMTPSAKPLQTPKGIPDGELDLWEEIRTCLAAGANTAAVMLCRKLLFHVAVSHGLPAKNDRDRAPSFIECVKHLEAEGIFTARMRPWVERIKDVGNEMNHEIEPTEPEVATDVATFTQQLLVLAYEMDALNAEASARSH